MDDADSLLSSVADVDLLANGLGAKTCPAGLAPLGNFTSAARLATHVPAAILHSKQWQRLLTIPRLPTAPSDSVQGMPRRTDLQGDPHSSAKSICQATPGFTARSARFFRWTPFH